MTGWRDSRGRAVDVPEPPESFYGPIGDFQGAHYARNAFALGTAQEAGFLAGALALRPGWLVLDVGCATGRHARALAGRGMRTVGVDVSAGLLAAAAAAGARGPGWARWVRGDARALPVPAASVDAVLCLCQGGFGLTPGGDRRVLAEVARVLRPGGRLALTAFSLVFAARWLAPGDALDARRGLHWHRAEVRGPDGQQRTFDLWTAAYGAAHLEDLLAGAGFSVDGLHGVEPGRYGTGPVTPDDPELLVLATRGGLA